MTCAGHTFLPNKANWSTSPKYARQYVTEIASGMTGAESRSSAWVWPRVTLKYLLTTMNLQDNEQTAALVREGAMSGLACCPAWGWGQVVAGASGTTVTLTDDGGWVWVAGDWVFLRNANEQWDVARVGTASLGGGIWTLTLDVGLARSYAAGLLAWPVFFGQPKFDATAVQTNEWMDAPVSISEIHPRAAGTAGVPSVVTSSLGIGAMAVGTSFAVA